MDYEIRKARDGDLDAVLAFCRRIWPERDYSERTWSDWQDNPKRMVWIAQRERKPIGIVRGEVLSSHEAWMEGLRVDPQVHSLGIGGALWRTLSNELKQIGMTAIRCLTAIDNTHAHRLFERQGFRSVLCLKRKTKRIVTGRPDRRLVRLGVGGTSVVREMLKSHTRRKVTGSSSAAGNLYCSNGVYWREWNETTLATHLEAGEVWVWEDQAPAAIAVMSTSAVRPGVWDVGLLIGSRAACRSLLDTLAVRTTVPLGSADYPPSIRTFLPLEETRLQGAAREAGFTSDRLRHRPMYLYEWLADRA